MSEGEYEGESEGEYEGEGEGEYEGEGEGGGERVVEVHLELTCQR